MRINSATELDVYQQAYCLAMRVFEVSKDFPSAEKFSLTDQLRRSSRSTCANLREAWAKRRYRAHFLSKLSDCDGENSETSTWLDFAKDCGYLAAPVHAELQAICRTVGKMLGAMITNPEPFLIEDQHPTSPLRPPPSVLRPPTSDLRPPFSDLRPPFSGFTLIELLAVVTIISILAALVIGIAGYAQRRAAVARTQAEMAEMMRALEAYKLDYGAYPGGGLGDASSSTNVHKALTRGRGYMTFTKNQLSISGTATNIMDPFGNNYRYRSDGSAAQRNKASYDLWSTGPSPTVTNQWITNWQ